MEIFIDKIKLLKSKNNRIFKVINFEELVKYLEELNELIEIYNVKTVILEHIRMLLILTLKNDNISVTTDDHMLHTVFYGQPGVGKSKTAQILAKIWKALGILKNIHINSSLNSKEILNRINSIREKYITLYEHHSKKDYKNLKNFDLHWLAIKNELSDLAEKVHSNVVRKIEVIQQDELIVVAGREDFVAEYSGQTAIKTLNFLKSCLGKCLIIEEAYLLYHGEADIYGMEALTVLNRFMNEFAPYIAIIFTGYEEKLINSIFKAQPGLKRRCQWIFNLKGYSARGLCQIFLKQIGRLGWSFENEDFVYDFFDKNYAVFINFGGDTEKLALRCKMMYSNITFDTIINSVENVEINLVLNQFILLQAFENYKLHDLF